MLIVLKIGNSADAEHMKYRKIKIQNDKIMNYIINVDGGIDLMCTVGFEQISVPSPADPNQSEEFFYFKPENSLE